MKKIIVAVFVGGIAGGAGAVVETRQAEAWERIELQGGAAEFRLRNDDRASVILGCQLNGVGMGFEFGEPIDETNRATVRGIPGERHNVAVNPNGDRMVVLAGGRGLNQTLDLLRTSARLSVRAGGGEATFEVFGSESVVSECIGHEEDSIGNPRPGFSPEE